MPCRHKRTANQINYIQRLYAGRTDTYLRLALHTESGGGTSTQGGPGPPPSPAYSSGAYTVNEDNVNRSERGSLLVVSSERRDRFTPDYDLVKYLGVRVSSIYSCARCLD